MKKKTDESYAVLEVIGESVEHLDDIINQLHVFGATEVKPKEIKLETVNEDQVLPDHFYSTTHHPTLCFYKNKWIEVSNVEMDGAIVVDEGKMSAKVAKICNIKEGDRVVVGIEGIKVIKNTLI